MPTIENMEDSRSLNLPHGVSPVYAVASGYASDHNRLSELHAIWHEYKQQTTPNHSLDALVEAQFPILRRSSSVSCGNWSCLT